MRFKNASDIYNLYFKECIMTDIALEKLHRVLLIMMDDIDFICRKYKIKYMLSGGSVLGAVRHGGFIPWDDDMDVMMYYDDMIKLCDYIHDEFGDKYLAVLPYCGQGPERMMKVYLRDTKYVEISKEGMPSPNMIFIDVFPIMNMPNNEKKRIKNDKKHYIASRMFSVGFDSKYPSSTILSKCKKEKELKKYYFFRRRLGFFARILGLNHWSRICSKLEKGEKTKTNYEGIPCGISYNREIFEADFFKEVIEWKFEEKHYFIPKRYHEYMTNLYGDYMKIPPVEKRKRHIMVEVNFGKYGEFSE